MAEATESEAERLDPKEVDALLHSFQDMDGTPGVNPDLVKPYRFGADSLAIMGNYQGLRMINERFCRLARSVFLPFLRTHPRITAMSPEVKSFDHYCEGLDNFVSLTTARMEELRGSQLIVLRPQFVSLLTNAYYGGDIAYLANERAEFTASEHRVIHLCTERLYQALASAWEDLFKITFAPPVHEDNLQFATFVESDEQVVCCSFTIQLPDVEPATFDLIYPLQALKPIASKLRTRMQSDQLSADVMWQKRLEDAVMSVPLTVTARLATPQVRLSQLVELTPGLVVPIDLNLRPQLLVEGKPLFDVEPGEQGGRAAVSLLRRCAAASQKDPEP